MTVKTMTAKTRQSPRLTSYIPLFILPCAIAIIGGYMALTNPPGGWNDIVGALLLIISAIVGVVLIIVAIVHKLISRRKLGWIKCTIISILAYVVAYLILFVLTRTN